MSFEKNYNLKEYAKNRILRIFPGLYLNILISVCILLYFGYVRYDSQFFGWLFAQLTTVQFYNAEMFREFGGGVINGSLWTISVELTFYIMLPILLYIFNKNRIYFFLLAILSFLVWNYDIASSKELFLNKLLHISILPYIFLFSIGIIFNKLFHIMIKIVEEKFFIWLFVFIVFNILIYTFDVELKIYIHILKWIIFSFTVFSFAFSFKKLSKRLLNGNDYTFGIYIYHMPIVNIFIHLNYVSEIKYAVMIFLLSIFLGIFSWHFIERPFLLLKKNSIFIERNKV